MVLRCRVITRPISPAAPVLYPVLGALFDSIGGLTAARALSLAEMLTATGLVYTMSRRLFNERVALCAAITFAVAEPTLFLGNLATYDATALCLLAVAAWLVVRTAAFRLARIPTGRAGRRARGRRQVRVTAVRAQHRRARRAGRRAETRAKGASRRLRSA